jgi:hypothetical protein
VEEGTRHFWLITLSHTPITASGVPVLYAGKEYKQFKVKAEDGGVLSMKIRKL